MVTYIIEYQYLQKEKWYPDTFFETFESLSYAQTALHCREVSEAEKKGVRYRIIGIDTGVEDEKTTYADVDLQR